MFKHTHFAVLLIVLSQGCFALEGLSDGQSTHYIGIEFAQAERWQRAELKDFDASLAYRNYGPKCPQRGPSDTGVVGEEACLVLNVSAPNEVEGAPVLVWFHGGGFTGGSGNDWVERSNRFTDAGIVFVSPNYRLGLLGNYDSSNQSGNFSLSDMQVALSWVRENIEYFGGDINNITIAGESAGGMAVQMLLASPASEELFHRAISQSGYGTWPMGVLGDSAMRQVDEYLTITQTPRDELTAEQLVLAVNGFLVPFVGDEYLPHSPASMFDQGRQQKVPLIIGANSYDGSVFPGAGITPETVFRMLGDSAMPIFGQYLTAFGSQELAFTNLFGEMRYALSAWVLSAAHAKSDQRTYLYYFDYVPEVLEARLPGAPHGIELPLLMNYDGGWSAPTSGEEMGERLADIWISFIRTGDMPANKHALIASGNDERVVNQLGDMNDVEAFRQRMQAIEGVYRTQGLVID